MESSERTPLIVNTDSSPSKPHKGVSRSVSLMPEEPEFSFKAVPRRKKLIFVSMAFVNFCASCCFSLLAPFFPIEAGKKGASQTTVGLIFGFFEMIIFISSPIFGNYISKVGCKFMFLAGVMTCGTTAILFGTLDMCPDGTIFIVMCFLVRGVEALGCSGLVTALFTILAHEFPGNVITVMGTLETFSGLGMMLGPPLGGALYALGGYCLPFFVVGSTVITCGLLISFIMPNIPEGEKMYKGSVLTLLKSPMVMVVFINLMAGSISLGFMDPTLANHLTQFNLKTWVVGLIFLIAPGVYAITAPLWGYIGDSKGYVRLMIGGGSFGGAIAILFLGPSPLLSFLPTTLYMNVIALALIGLFVGCSLIPTFKGLLLGANSMGFPNNLDTYGKVSGFFNSSFSLGAFLGPTIGGALADKFGFDWACTGIAGAFLFAAGLMALFCCKVPVLPEPSLNQSDVGDGEKHKDNDTIENHAQVQV